MWYPDINWHNQHHAELIQAAQMEHLARQLPAATPARFWQRLWQFILKFVPAYRQSVQPVASCGQTGQVCCAV